jgi:hypothetical protein
MFENIALGLCVASFIISAFALFRALEEWR